MSYILALLQRFLRYNIYKKELYLLYKYYSRLVLFCVLSSIIKLYRIIQTLIILDMEKVRLNNKMLIGRN